MTRVPHSNALPLEQAITARVVVADSQPDMVSLGLGLLSCLIGTTGTVVASTSAPSPAAMSEEQGAATAPNAAPPAETRDDARQGAAVAVRVQERPSAILELAPGVFRLAKQWSGVGAVVAGWIEREKLYESADFASMREYAETKLGVTSVSAFKKLRQAAKAAWEFYPERAEAVLAVLLANGHARVHGEMPDFPDETMLYLLPRAYEQTDPEQRGELLAAVLDRKCHTRDLEKIAGRGRTARRQAERNSNERPEAKSVSAAEQSLSEEVGTEPSRKQLNSKDLAGGGDADLGQDPVSTAIWALQMAVSAVEGMRRDQVEADHWSRMRELVERILKTVESHEETPYE